MNSNGQKKRDVRLFPQYQYNMMRWLFLAAFGIISLLSVEKPVYAQKMNAELLVHLEQLPLEEQTYLKDLRQSLLTLINNYPWIGGQSNRDFPLRIDLFLTSETDANTVKKYTAGMMMALPTGIQLRDPKWEFRYTRDDKPHFGNPYDTFTSLIEFYIWICLGYEVDKMAPTAGTPFYEKARLIAENSPFESRYYTGWENRRSFIKDLMQDSTYINLRLASFYVNGGLFYAGQGAMDQAAQYFDTADDYILNCKPDQMELKRDDHVIRWVKIDDYIAAMKQTGQQEVIDRIQLWNAVEK